MTNDELLAELRAQVAELRAEVRALQRHDAPATSAPTVSQSATPSSAHTGTSRRGLLRGAAAATAAAAVATVAVGATEQAHAAPTATGGNLVLGHSNDANATTALTNTSGSQTGVLLTVDNSGSGSGMQAIQAKTAGGAAVYGNDTGSGYGIHGQTYSGAGVYGEANTGVGVMGTSGNGIAISALSSLGVDIKCAGTGRFSQKLQLEAGPPIQGTYTAGESIRDINAELWLCMVSGTPGTWARVPHLAAGSASSGYVTYLGKPLRIFDSRAGAADALFHPGVPCASNAVTTVAIGDAVYQGISIPHAPPGAIGNVTVVVPSGAGYVALVPSGVGFQGTSNLNYYAGQTLANAFNVQLNGGALDIIIGGAATDVIIDLFAIIS